jgi:hypothetical protein
MDRSTRMLAGLIRCLAGLLGEHRRAWMHALLAETGEQPTPSARLAGLLVLSSCRVQFTSRVLPTALGIGVLTAGCSTR